MTDSERHLDRVTIRLGDHVPAELRKYLDPMAHPLERYRADEDAVYFTATTHERPDGHDSYTALLGALIVLTGCVGSAAFLGWSCYWMWCGFIWLWRWLS